MSWKTSFQRLPAAGWQAFCALAAAAGLPNAALAETAEDPSRLSLEPSVIIAVGQSSPVTLVTDPKQPRQPIPASDGADYLKTIPGFTAIRNGGTNGDPVLRGMFGSRLNILTNGSTLLGACPSRMDAPTAYIAPETYDSLEVIKGPQSVIWGPMGSAGTVRFERQPESFGELGARLNASLVAGSNGRFDRLLDTAFGDNLGYLRFIGNSSQSDDYQDGAGDQVPSRWDKWNGDLAVGWTADADSLLEFSAGKGDGEARYAGRSMDGSQFKRESLGLRFEKSAIGDVFEALEAQLYYNYADHLMDNYSLRTPPLSGPMAGAMASNVDRRTLGGRLAGTWRWPSTELVAGIDGQSNQHRQRRGLGIDTYDQQPWDKDASFHSYGGFAELTWYASDNGRLIGGLRIDQVAVKDYRKSLGTGSMTRPNPSRDARRTDSLQSGFLRYEHDLEESTTLYLGLGHVQRFPDYWELFSPKSGPDGSANAFEGIQPEKTTQLDFGVQYQDQQLKAWASGYLGQIDDYILFEYRPGKMGLHSQARNLDARIMGGELGLSYHLDEHWKSEATLAYAWGKNTSDDRALPQMPPLEGRLGLSYETEQWSAGALWRLVAEQGRISRGQGNVVGFDFDESPGFGVFSVNAAYRFSKNFKLSAGVDNLFDKDYAEHLNLAGNAGFGFAADDPQALHEPGRTLWSKLDFTF